MGQSECFAPSFLLNSESTGYAVEVSRKNLSVKHRAKRAVDTLHSENSRTYGNKISHVKTADCPFTDCRSDDSEMR